MLKGYNQSLDEFNPGPAEGVAKAEYVKRLGEIMGSYTHEAIEDLKNKKSYFPRISGGVAAGHILSMFGNYPLAMQFFNRALAIQKLNYPPYYQSQLTEVVEIMDNSNVPEIFSRVYKRRLKDLERKKQSKKKLREFITNTESDMECASGDLDEIYPRGKTDQALAYQKLGELEKAISLFEESTSIARDWRFRNSVQNSLSIIDCYLDLNNIDKARETFFNLTKKIASETPKPGEVIPEYISENFGKFLPYIKRLGLEESLDNLAGLAKERLKIFHKKRKLENNFDFRRTIELLVDYYADKNEFKQASDLIDEARTLANKEKYPSGFSLREQAEYLIRAGETERAERLIEEDHNSNKHSSPFDKKSFEFAALYLQLQKPDKALEMLGEHVEDYKRCESSSLSEILETRREQIKILAKLIGPDYLELIAQHMGKAKEDSFLLPEVVKQRKKRLS
ncbi:MAG: hypothetical protein Q8N63_08875 [Nanoarchaeota archaeon]|nr:hypothetical protein [Nanoarchaeota archaeon]